MALSYYTPTKPYTAPRLPGQQVQNSLYRAIGAGNSAAPGWQLVSSSQGASPNSGSSALNQGRNGAPQLPPGEFGENQSAPLHVGQAPVGGWPTATSPASGASSGGGGGGGGGFGMPSFEDDPILARTKALWAKNVAQAEAAALAGRKQAEIGYGYDPAYTYADQATQQAAQQNAFSDLANLLYQHTERSRATDAALNQSNLWYSGERANQLGREGRQYTLEQTLANQGFQGKLAGLSNALMQTRQAEQEAILQAEENAYNRELEFALANGTGFPGDGRGGGGGGGGGPSLTVPGGNLGGADENAALSAAMAMAQQRGWGAPSGNPSGPELMDQGMIFHDDQGRPYVRVKFGTPQGNSTEDVPL